MPFSSGLLTAPTTNTRGRAIHTKSTSDPADPAPEWRVVPTTAIRIIPFLLATNTWGSAIHTKSTSAPAGTVPGWRVAATAIRIIQLLSALTTNTWGRAISTSVTSATAGTVLEWRVAATAITTSTRAVVASTETRQCFASLPLLTATLCNTIMIFQNVRSTLWDNQ